MEIILTGQFEQAYEKLDKVEKKNVLKALALIGDDPKYPGLRVKKLKGRPGVWEARPFKRLRLIFEMSGEAITVRNVGEHDKVLKGTQ